MVESAESTVITEKTLCFLMLLAQPLTDRMIGLAIGVHRHTSSDPLESVYGQCLFHELEEASIALRAADRNFQRL